MDIALSILNTWTKLLLPAPFAPMMTFRCPSSKSSSNLMDLKPFTVMRFISPMVVLHDDFYSISTYETDVRIFLKQQ